MKRSFFRAYLGGVLFLAFASSLLVGCSGPESANKSDRPWNTPRSWENGLPSGINEGR